MILSKKQLYLITVLLAFCSISYELIFTQVFSLVIGSQVKQFNLIISFFTFSLGLGSLAYLLLKKTFKNLQILTVVEILLFIIGALSPFLIIYLSSVITSFYFFKFIAYSICILIGFLSGLELPIMINLSSQEDSSLSADYFGMVLASLLIPITFIPFIGIASSCLLISTLNLFILLYIHFHKKKYFIIALFISYVVFSSIIIYFHQNTNGFMRHLYMNQGGF